MSLLGMLFGEGPPLSTSFPMVPHHPENISMFTKPPIAYHNPSHHNHLGMNHLHNNHPHHHEHTPPNTNDGGGDDPEVNIPKHNHSYFDHWEEMPEEVREFINQRYNLNLVMKSIELNEDTAWESANGTNNGTSTTAFEMVPWKVILDKVVTYVMTINVIGIMLGMGCAIYWKDVINNLWPPIGIIIGMCGQFLVLPACGFGFSILFGLTAYEALGCLVVSCCPGGSFSNFFTFWVEGDLALSIVMTACSSVIAFGGMPLNLWLYSSYFVGDESNFIVIPYMNIMMSLVFICGPVIIGMIIRHFSMKVARIITKITSIVGYVGFVVVLTSWLVLFWEVFLAATPLIYVSAILLPITGFLLAYIVAFLLRRTHKVCRTIGIETGSQNMPVALSIILLSFDNPQTRARMILFPTLYGVFMLVEVFAGIGLYRGIKACQKNMKTRRDSTSKQYPLSHTARFGNGTPAEKEKLNV